MKHELLVVSFSVFVFSADNSSRIEPHVQNDFPSCVVSFASFALDHVVNDHERGQCFFVQSSFFVSICPFGNGATLVQARLCRELVTV